MDRQPGAGHPHQAADELSRVALRVLPLDDVLRGMGPPSAWLGDDEARRLAGFRAEHRRAQFLAGHWLARRLAVEVAGGDPASWAWDPEPGGRPGLRREGRRLHASLSHSGNWVAAAVGGEPLGIDVEVSPRERDWRGLARFAFSAGEVKRLEILSGDALRQEFLHRWALREARGKALGEGLLPGRARQISASECAAENATACSWALAGGCAALVAASPVHASTLLPPPFANPRFWTFDACAA